LPPVQVWTENKIWCQFGLDW